MWQSWCDGVGRDVREERHACRTTRQQRRRDMAAGLKVGVPASGDAKDAIALTNLGNTLQAQGKLAEAIAAFRRALAIDPELPEAWYNLGNALQAEGELDEAVASYRRAIECKQDFPIAF